MEDNTLYEKSILNDKTTMLIVINGNFDYTFIKTFNDLQKELIAPFKQCTIDLTKSTYIDSSGIGMLLTLKEHLDKEGLELKISIKDNTIKELFDLANLNNILPIFVE